MNKTQEHLGHRSELYDLAGLEETFQFSVQLGQH